MSVEPEVHADDVAGAADLLAAAAARPRFAGVCGSCGVGAGVDGCGADVDGDIDGADAAGAADPAAKGSRTGFALAGIALRTRAGPVGGSTTPHR